MMNDKAAHDFSSAVTNYAMTYSGSDRKHGIIWHDMPCLLKYPDKHSRRTDISTSYVNNIFSEYIGSHIAQAIGIPTQDTFLGYYKDEPCVVCRDFKNEGENLIEFQDFLKMIYNSDERKRHVNFRQLYSTINNPDLPLRGIRQEAAGQYWDIFVIDAFLGNFDRHAGNWGYIHKNGILKPSPTYDYGSTLFPQLSDIGRDEKINDVSAMLERTFVFPSSQLVLSTEKTGKVSYYDMLCSGVLSDVSAAVRRIAPKIDMRKVDAVIDNTPMITQMQRDFYKTILRYRKTFIIDKALDCAVENRFDDAARHRVLHGYSVTTEDVDALVTKYGGNLDAIAQVSRTDILFPAKTKYMQVLPQLQANLAQAEEEMAER